MNFCGRAFGRAFVFAEGWSSVLQRPGRRHKQRLLASASDRAAKAQGSRNVTLELVAAQVCLQNPLLDGCIDCKPLVSIKLFWRHETSSTYPEVEPRFIPQRGSSPSFAVGTSAVKTSPAQHQLLALEQRAGLLVWSWCWESRAFSSTFPRWRMFREQPRRIGKAQANCGMGAVQVQRAGTVLRAAASKWLEALNATLPSCDCPTYSTCRGGALGFAGSNGVSLLEGQRNHLQSHGRSLQFRQRLACNCGLVNSFTRQSCAESARRHRGDRSLPRISVTRCALSRLWSAIRNPNHYVRDPPTNSPKAFCCLLEFSAASPQA